ncbi:hypothetical protein, partial [Mobiluncus mulieris]
MKHEFRKSRGGGSLNRLGIATLSGLLVVGLTPALTNLAFADGGTTAPTVVKGTDAGKIEVAVDITGDETEGKAVYRDGQFKAKFTKDGTSDGGDACKEVTGDSTKIKKFDDNNFGVVVDAVQAADTGKLTENKKCIYDVTLEKDDQVEGSGNWAVAEASGNVVASVKITFTGTSGGVTVAADPDNKKLGAKYTKPHTVKFYTDEDPNKLIGAAAEVPAGKTLTQASVTVPDAAAACKKETGKTPTLTGWYAKGDNSKADVANLATTAVNSNLEYVAKCTYVAPPAATTHEVTFKSDDNNAIATVGESGKVTVANDKKLTDSENTAALAAVKKVTAEQACKASSTDKKNLIGWVSNNSADNLVTFAGTDATANPEIASAMTEFTAVCVADATLDKVSFTKVVKIGTEEKTDGSETIKPTGIFYAELAAKTNDCPNAGEGNQHAEITGSGVVSFDSLALKFSKAGECKYNITEHIIENKDEDAKNWGMPTAPATVKVKVAPKKSGNDWSLEAKQDDTTPVNTTKLVNTAPVRVIFDAGDGSIKANADITGLAKVENQNNQLSAEGKENATGLQALAGKAQAALKAPDADDKKFAGWALSNAATTVVAVPDTFTTAVTYKAVWAKDATVTFKNDKGTEIGTLKKPASSLVDTTITTAKKVDLTKSEDVCVPEAGKTKILTAWKYDRADGVDYSSANAEMSVADLAKRHVINNGVFTAVCKEAVTVTYVQKDKQTKVTEEKIVKDTGKLSWRKDGQYITPTQAGCASDTDTLGWKNKSGDSEVTAGSTFAENTTVYAECTASGKVLAKFLKKSGEQIVSNTLTLSGGKVTPEAEKSGVAITSEQAGCTATDTLSWEPALGEIAKDTTYTAVCTPNPSTPSVTPGNTGSGSGSGGSAGGYYGGSAGGAADSSSAADKGK